MNAGFVHLHAHSEYSLVDGIARVDDLVAAAAADGMPALALTDLSNAFAVVKFYRAAVSAGVKPIVGADLWMDNLDQPNQPYRLVVLCQDEEGFRNLSRLLTRAYTDNPVAGRACIRREWLREAGGRLIVLSGGMHGDVGQALAAHNLERARALAGDFAALFPDRYYLELQRIGRVGEEVYNQSALTLAVELSLPVVATNQVQFLRAEDFEAHEVRVCIQDGRVLSDTRRPRRFTEQQYLRPSAEMAELFADVPEAIANTVEIAKRCNVEITLGRYFLPEFPVAQGERVEEVLYRRTQEGLDTVMAEAGGRDGPPPAYRQRLALELDVINQMGFAGYFLIVADFIRWAKEHGIPVGPGRGSGAGSLVAYALGITELDPIEHGLLFERFLNPERVSLPDFDIDFCMERRDRVIEYVADRYGRDRVAQIITYGTMAARAVVRDVGRVLDHPYGFVDQLAKLIPFEIGMTLDKALEQEELLRNRYENEPEVKELLDMARALEGLARNAGKHAGGVVIAPSALTDFTPLYSEQSGRQLVTQLDKDDLETIGLVKFDFLGLRTLTVIDKAVAMINARGGESGEGALDIRHIPLDDPQTYALLKSCKTTALFQLESRGMKDLIQRLQPDTFEEIVALVALFRPGPLQSGMVDDFVNRKHGRAKIEYPHPALAPILEPTYGVILYQEQVMQIAQALAGYSLGAADLLRRAMGKKKAEAMADQRSVFIKGAVERNTPERQASYIFDLMEKFAGYGFNKSHSAAYALIAYQTSWLKTHYPATYMSAAMSADMEHTDKIVTLIAECRDLNIEILPPDVNRCEHSFGPVSESCILYGLGAIKGVGRSAIEAIVEARAKGGDFEDLFDLCERVDLKRVNRRVFDALIRAGALDALGTNRASLAATLPTALNVAEQRSKNRDLGQVDLFGVEAGGVASTAATQVAEWPEDQRLDGEKETLGLFLTGHPIERYETELAQVIDARLADLRPTEDRTVVVAGLAVGLRTMNTRRGDRMAFLTLDDRSGRLEIAVFSDLYARARDVLRKDKLLVVSGQVSVDEFSGGFRMSAESIYDIDQARAAFADRLVIEIGSDVTANGFIGRLQSILRPFTDGTCPVVVRYQSRQAEAELSLGAQWRVRPSAEVLDALAGLAGSGRVYIDYAHAVPARIAGQTLH
jgi:DNA polymerase-3 subunit alpha